MCLLNLPQRKQNFLKIHVESILSSNHWAIDKAMNIIGRVEFTKSNKQQNTMRAY